MTIMTRTCDRCGKSFSRSESARNLAERAGQKVFCSRECRRNRVQRQCEECGKTFEVTASVAAKSPSRWCSRECGDIGRKRGENRTCIVCGKSFYIYPSQITHGRRTNEFCSIACYSGQYRSARITGANLGYRWTDEQRAKIKGRGTGPKRLYSHTCTHCGKTFTQTGKTHRAASRFCTTACWYEYIRLHPEKHPAYKGGFYPYFGQNWPEQSRRARERDQHTCQRCGLHQTSPQLPVHHIRPRRLFNGDYIAGNDLSNLVTLCPSCHKKVESAAVPWMPPPSSPPRTMQLALAFG